MHRSRKWHPFQYSCLENPMDIGAWQTTVHGVTKEVVTLQVNNKNLGLTGRDPPPARIKIQYSKSWVLISSGLLRFTGCSLMGWPPRKGPFRRATRFSPSMASLSKEPHTMMPWLSSAKLGSPGKL